MNKEHIERATKAYTENIIGLDFKGEMEVEFAFKAGAEWALKHLTAVDIADSIYSLMKREYQGEIVISKHLTVRDSFILEIDDNNDLLVSERLWFNGGTYEFHVERKNDVYTIGFTNITALR